MGLCSIYLGMFPGVKTYTRLNIGVYEGFLRVPQSSQCPQTITITILGMCWARAGSSEPFVLGKQYTGIGMLGMMYP